MAFRLLLLVSEVFDSRVSRLGGFGWTAKRVAETFAARPALGVDVWYGTPVPRIAAAGRTDSGVPIVGLGPRRLTGARGARQARPDLVLTVDYRRGFAPALAALPRTPTVVWIRDPRTASDLERIATLTIPGEPHPPQGIAVPDVSSLRTVLRWRDAAHSPTALAVPARFLVDKVPATYGVVGARTAFLPNPIPLSTTDDIPTGMPRVVFLGRLDPIKRPWIVVETARLLPDVEFVLMGRNHFSGPGSWQPADLPSNVVLAGHVDGQRKTELLRSAHALMLTSIHESLPNAILEAFDAGVPVIASVDPDDLVSRFGSYVGRWPGDGLESVPRFADAVRRTLDERTESVRRAGEARDWLRATYGEEAFLSGLAALAADLGVAAPWIEQVRTPPRPAGLSRATATTAPDPARDV